MKQYQIFDTKWQWIWAGCFLLFFAPSLLMAQADTVSVNALNPVAGKASLYSVDFTLSDTLYPDAEFEFTFPAGFDVSNVTIAGSKTINGGFTVEVDGQKVVAKRKGRGAIKLPGERVDVMISTVSNPSEADVIHRIDIKIKVSQPATPSEEMSGSVLIADKKVQ